VFDIYIYIYIIIICNMNATIGFINNRKENKPKALNLL
jgi:hypothetical protein